MLLINIPSLVEDTNHPQIIVDKSQCLTCVIFLLERDSSVYRQHWLTTCIHPFSFFSPVLAYGLTDLQVQFVDTEKLDQQRKNFVPQSGFVPFLTFIL